jgi:hypothetical protein
MRDEQTARDLCASYDSCGEAGDGERAVIAIQLEEVRLHGMEGIERHAAGERGVQHDPAHGPVTEPVRNRCAQHAPDFVHKMFAPSRREPDVAHQRVGESECRDQDDRA